MILAARKPEQLKPLESDIQIRYKVNCISQVFDALKYDSHSRFFDSLQPRPEVSICVFGILTDEILAFEDWKLTDQMINTNYTGAVSILNVIAK